MFVHHFTSQRTLSRCICHAMQMQSHLMTAFAYAQVFWSQQTCNVAGGSLASLPTTLRQLHMEDSLTVTSASLPTLSRLRSLEYLRFANLAHASDAFAECLAKHLPTRLTELELSSHPDWMVRLCTCPEAWQDFINSKLLQMRCSAPLEWQVPSAIMHGSLLQPAKCLFCEYEALRSCLTC